MTAKVFIDGKAGTTGLRIYERLGKREDLQLLTLCEEDRKNPEKRKEMLNSCDIAFLCLPDAASREAVAMIENENTIVIDASTAHRTLDGWAYGFPELAPEFLQKIQNSHRIAVPGCHAGGFVVLVYPLTAAGLISRKTGLVCHSLTGYSGGGKKMIAEYEDPARPVFFDSPREYALAQQHKHLKEMTKIPGLERSPVFCPIVGDFYSGMLVTVPLFREDLLNGASIDDVKKVYRDLYTGPIVRWGENLSENGLMSSNALSGSDTMQITVEGNEERILLMARFDNLGKGASGAAVECMNIALKQEPGKGLNL